MRAIFFCGRDLIWLTRTTLYLLFGGFFLIGSQDDGSDMPIKPDHIHKITQQRDSLNEREHDVGVRTEKDVWPEKDTEHG